MHFHQWISIAAQSLRQFKWSALTRQVLDDEGSPITEVLQRCSRCDNLRTITLDGTWTIEQITGGTPR